MHRRRFLKHAVILIGATARVSAAGTTTGQKLGLNSYCLRAWKWRDEQVLDYAASLKLDGIFLQDSTDPDTAQLEHWKEVGAHARSLKLGIQTGVGAVLPRNETDFNHAREQLLLGIARATAVGSPIVRCLHAGDRAHLPAGTMKQHREMMVKLLHSVRSQALDAGLKFAIENHKDLQAAEMRCVIEAAGPDFVGSYLDTGNPVFVAENPLTTVETLAPYALCLHLRDSAIFEADGGAMVQWVPLGAGQVDFASIVRHIHKIKPDIYVYNKPITGRPAQLIPYLQDDFWKGYDTARAEDLAHFMALARRGKPYEEPMVVEDLGGTKVPEAYLPAIQLQQKQHMEEGIAYAKNKLGLGVRWRV